MSPQNRTVERIIARIASRAHGVVTWREMRRAGVSEAEIKWRLKKGLLIPVYPGVYRGRALRTEPRRHLYRCGKGLW
jgi:hypothetical protein